MAQDTAEIQTNGRKGWAETDGGARESENGNVKGRRDRGAVRNRNEVIENREAERWKWTRRRQSFPVITMSTGSRRTSATSAAMDRWSAIRRSIRIASPTSSFTAYSSTWSVSSGSSAMQSQWLSCRGRKWSHLSIICWLDWPGAIRCWLSSR